jgi:hypothetical protein
VLAGKALLVVLAWGREGKERDGGERWREGRKRREGGDKEMERVRK